MSQIEVHFSSWQKMTVLKALRIRTVTCDLALRDSSSFCNREAVAYWLTQKDEALQLVNRFSDLGESDASGVTPPLTCAELTTSLIALSDVIAVGKIYIENSSAIQVRKYWQDLTDNAREVLSLLAGC